MIFIAYYLDSVGNRLVCTVSFLILCTMVYLFWRAPDAINRRLHREVLKAHYQACTQCGYCLHGLPAEHKCPECGNDYDFDSLEREWQRWFETGSVKSDTEGVPASKES